MTRLGQTRTPSLPEVLRAAVQQGVENLFVALPGKVEKYDSIRQVANVKPLLKRPVIFDDGTEGVDTLPVLMDVPIVFPRGGGFFLTLPLVPGDNVLLIFMDRSIDSFAVSAGNVDLDPVDFRSHDLSDAVALAGFYPQPKAIKDVIAGDLAIGKEKGTQARFKSAGLEITTLGAPTARSFVAMADLVLSELQKIQTALSTHTHPGVTTGPGTTQAAPPSYIPGSVQSTNLKAD